MITLTNDQMVEISGGINTEALSQDVCLACYAALASAGLSIAAGAAATPIGAIIEALFTSIDVFVSCKPCVQAVMGE
ncbi:MAG: hypothetical protein J6T97_05525 [Bacteroidaceae bacterium]|nr:hypothetical protein [Bacteroidaceae bacterium]